MFLAQGFFNSTELFQALQPFEFALGLREESRSVGRWARGWFQVHVADVEVFLEPVRLQQVGKLEGTDITAALADFALEVSDDPAQVHQRKARP